MIINDHKKVYIIETTKNSDFRLTYDPGFKKLKLKRVTSTTYPSAYGRIEILDKEGDIIKNNKEKEDFFLVSNLNLPQDLAITEDQVTSLGTFICLDTRNNQIDNKHVIALKEEVKRFPNHKLMTELDYIRVFLITLRGSFKVTGFTAAPALPQQLKILFQQVDWANQSLWPSTFKGDLESGYCH